jgi:hypothetical protein
MPATVNIRVGSSGTSGKLGYLFDPSPSKYDKNNSLSSFALLYFIFSVPLIVFDFLP